MIKRIANLKYLIATFLFVTLFFIQSLTLTWTPGYAFQALILNIAIMLGIYAFSGFDNSTTYSLNSCIVSYISGTFLGVLFALIPIVFFTPRLPRLTFFVTAAVSGLIFPFLSCVLMRYTIKHLPPRRYLVIGREEELGPILEEVKKASMGKIEIYSYMNPSAATLTETMTFEEVKPFDAILIGDPKLAKDVESVLSQRSGDVALEYLPIVVESALHRIPMKMIDLFSDYYDVVFSQVQISHRKRVLDLVISSFALIILSPVFLILWLLIVIEDGRPGIFTQERVGLNNKTFRIHKFRSMKKNSESEGSKYATQQGDNITRLGRIMRPFRLDEIPQFYDIFKGNMSFIGPRPEQPGFAEELATKLPYYKLRHKLKTGLSGWAQTNYKYAATIEEQEKKLSYDLYYVKNQSTMLDLQIILKTFETVVFRKGAK
ncbi:polyprenyl glycosylphosphotransferase [Mesotoga sp. Brook.08.105.5.1]|uniref:sugar transferase n=1 Tax=Mesotoga sp. Brook.08.105.5.1 TaxID=1421002 RepID=UPI000C1A03A6|nr:sugar transferase [Mesotoga sp. Brook.08.105.5.1]PVD16206.1 polyprenyl glycosylphosphotransferase [Mesotoga sp. Brook.08.105.5.1]